MEVLEHVDNPATFLSTCAELLKVRPMLKRLSSVTELIVPAAAWRTPISIDNITYPSRICPNYSAGRRYSPPSNKRDAHLLKIYQTF